MTTTVHPQTTRPDPRILVTLSGHQSLTSLADVMHVLSGDANTNLIDFGQLVVHNRFISTALLSTSQTSHLPKELLFRAHAKNIAIHLDLAPTSSQTDGYHDNENEYIITVFSPRRIPASFLARVTTLLITNSASLRHVARVSREKDDYSCFELRARMNGGDIKDLRRDLFQLGREDARCDVALQRADAQRMAKRLVVFDLSFTLVRCDAIDVLLEAAGKRTEREKGEGGETWLRERVEMLRGVDAEQVVQKAVNGLVFTDGAREVCKELKTLGCKIAIVSSGAFEIASAAKDQLGLDFVFANVLERDQNGIFTGEVSEPVVCADRKAELMCMLAMQEGVGMDQVIAVGDGPVSSKMLAEAGMGIAFDQPPTFEMADALCGRIASKSLVSVLYLVGITGHHFRSVARLH